MLWAVLGLSGANLVTLWLWYRTSREALTATRDLMAATRRADECTAMRNADDQLIQTYQIRLKQKEDDLANAYRNLRDAGGRCEALGKKLATHAAPESLRDLVNDELRAISNLSKGRPPTHR
jgi:hypothetical protein